MFDVGWPELLVIAVVMIVVVGPKDLPRMLRTFGKTTAKFRSMAGDFRRQFDQALREAELDDLKSAVDTVRDLNPKNLIRKELDPIAKAAQDVRSGLDTMMKPAPRTDDKAAATAHAEEPAKAGAAPIPGGEPAAAEEHVFQLGPSPLPAATAVHAQEPLKAGPIGTVGEAAAKPKRKPAKKGKTA